MMLESNKCKFVINHSKAFKRNAFKRLKELRYCAGDSYSTLNLNGMINYSICKNRGAFNSSISLEAGDMGAQLDKK